MLSLPDFVVLGVFFKIPFYGDFVGTRAGEP
jgi:hypothetical protein